MFHYQTVYLLIKLLVYLLIIYFFKYCNLNDSYESAPYRAVTVYDALSDLPEIKNGHENEEMQYESEPITHFQRKVNLKTNVLFYNLGL